MALRTTGIKQAELEQHADKRLTLNANAAIIDTYDKKAASNQFERTEKEVDIKSKRCYNKHIAENDRVIC